MNESGSPERAAEQEDNRLLLHEAGYDWHPQGLNQQVYEAIQKRENLLDELVKNQHDVHEDQRESLWNDYMNQAAEVVRLKEQFGIDDPPWPEIPSTEE